MTETEMQTPGEAYSCPTCGRKPSEALTYVLIDGPHGLEINEMRCNDKCHAEYDAMVPMFEQLTNDRNNLSLQLAAMRGAFNMIANGIQQAFFTGFVEGRSGKTDAEEQWLKSLMKKTVEDAQAEAAKSAEQS